MIRVTLLLLVLSWSAWGQVQHGAPIRALAVLSNGDVVSAGLDSAIFVWRGGQVRLLRFHESGVEALWALPEGGVASRGGDGRVAYWGPETERPERVESQGEPPGSPLATVGADGLLRLFGPGGAPRGEIDLSAGPLVGLAVRGDFVAVASLSGAAIVVDVAAERIVSVVHTGEAAIWAVAFMADGTLLTGGSGRSVRRWDALTGRALGSIGPGPVVPVVAGDRGAQVFRACAVCHALTPDAGTRAGPSLHGLFGRPVGGLAGYRYSEALRSKGGVWTVAALSDLLAAGPQAFAPGTTMPEQILADPEDRAALARFLGQAR